VLREQACRPDAPIDAEDFKLTSILLKYQKQLLLMMRPVIETRLRQLTRDRQNIEDLRQDVYLRLAEKDVEAVPSFTSLEGYVSRIARNVAVDWIRRTQRERKSTGGVDMNRTSFGAHPPEAILIRSEEIARMRRAFLQLPELQQRLLELRFTHGYSLKGIATGMKVDYNTMRQAYYKAILRIRKAMNEERPRDEELSADEERDLEEWQSNGT
jgi:RNA polymerase sigma-70 factor (ECF subfamily)